MMKKFLSTTLGGALLLLGAGAADASPIVSSPSGLTGDVSITGYMTSPSTYTVTATNLAGDLVFSNTSFTNGHIKACGIVTFVPGAPSPPIVGDFDPCQTIFDTGANGSFSADFAGITSLNFAAGADNSSALNKIINISFNGTSSLFNQTLPPNGIGPVNSSLAITVAAIDASSFTLNITENCPSPGTTTCVYEILQAIAALGNPNTVDTIDGPFTISAGSQLVVPEPTSLALLSAGLAGLGIIRRKKAA